MTKIKQRAISLGCGEVQVYNFGTVHLHNYSTNDPLQDQVIVFERGGTAVILENPSFLSSGKELMGYLRRKGICPVGKLLAYHMCGARFLPGVLAYSTVKALEYGATGAGKAMVDGFSQTFGDDFDASISIIDELVEPGYLRIDGFAFELLETDDAFDVVLPELNVLYTHMLGANTHSIVPSKAALDALIARLTVYSARDFDLVLSSHHPPEGADAIKVKLAYLRDLDAQARAAGSAEEFLNSMRSRYPSYSGNNYLEMTAKHLLT